MSYENFAYVYDALMEEAPYPQWLRWVMRQRERNGVKGRRMLDLACGTGELSLLLAREGFEVTGVDLSEDMLAVASGKALAEGARITFLKQDMRALCGLHDFDIVAIFCDSLNYLETETDVKETFRHVHAALKAGGMFLFDVHSVYKTDVLFPHHTFADNGDEVSYIWNCFPGEGPHAVEHDLSFFVYDEKSGLYERFDELHKQRTFPVADYENWLTESGFDCMPPAADFTEEAPGPKSERIFFTCIKR